MSKITVYSAPNCPWCHTLKDFLKEKNIEFEEIDISKDQAKVQEMTEKSGQMGVPQIEINGKMIIGFDKEAIEKELENLKSD